MITFNEKYHNESFASFLTDFLPEDYLESEKDLSLLEGCKIITKVKEIGHCESLDVTVLEMTHSKSTDPRVAVATDAFRILKEYDMQKALVIFHNDESENYRFSYLTITLDINNKNKITKTYSNARRYSFYLGTGAKIKTPTQQLITKGRILDTDDLLNRFSVEVVNKEFYLEIAKHFDELVDEEKQILTLPFQNDPNVRKSFAVRLIGRLMFCWFLKQKKSHDGQLIPDEILSSIAVKNNYYHEILERLFFEVLNTDIDNRDIRNEFFDKVPYLNGGLFSPQTEDYYDYDRDTFISRNINTLKINDGWFKKFFELLELYNFTIDENTLFDQELSVDPEMLGRIFENLLAEINPETGSSERKRTGSFYTPRQIVEYMVDQSLLGYLKTKTDITDEKLTALISYDPNDDKEHPLLDDEKQNIVDAVDMLQILDPACGSGAYPIGVLQKVVYILQTVDSDGVLWRDKKLKDVPELYRQKIEDEFNSKTKDYIRKLEVIKNSIFGVDIQPIAVEVSRLRCFLTLVVEDEIDDSRKNRGVEALPNLDFKFVCANTLIPAPEQVDENNQLFGDDFQENLASAVDKYFSSAGETKLIASNEIHKLIDGKVDEKLKHVKRLFSYNGNKKIESVLAKANEKKINEHSRILLLWNSYKNIFENKMVGFFDPKYFFPSVKDGFDIVIGNPPYIKEYTNKSAFDGLKESPYYQGKMDLWYMFSCIGIDYLKENGIECFIAQNNWVTSAGASKMRDKIIKDTQIINLVDFGNYKIFETAGIQTMVMIFQKNTVKENYNFDYRRLVGETPTLKNIFQILAKVSTKNVECLNLEIDRAEMLGTKMTFFDKKAGNVLKKLSVKSNFALTTKEVANGIHHHHDRVNKNRQKILGSSFNVNDGIFVLSDSEKVDLNCTEIELELLKPSYTTKQLHKWHGDSTNKEWTIYTDSSFKDVEKIESYPNIKFHLDKFTEVITSDNKPYGLHRARAEKFFKEEKIIAVRKCASPTFTYTDFDCYVSATFYVIQTERLNQKYLTGLLNSSLIAFWLKNKGKMQGSNYQIDKEPLLDLPLLKVTSKEQAVITELVDEILTLKERDNGSDITELETKINEAVMSLYELTEEEKEIIRNS